MEKEQLMEWCKGNIGALNFLMLLRQPINSVEAKVIMPVLEKATSIRGTNLWVLYSDLCDRSLKVVSELCQKCPIEVLEDACSRQDYSGRELVREYLYQDK